MTNESQRKDLLILDLRKQVSELLRYPFSFLSLFFFFSSSSLFSSELIIIYISIILPFSFIFHLVSLLAGWPIIHSESKLQTYGLRLLWLKKGRNCANQKQIQKIVRVSVIMLEINWLLVELLNRVRSLEAIESNLRSQTIRLEVDKADFIRKHSHQVPKIAHIYLRR